MAPDAGVPQVDPSINAIALDALAEDTRCIVCIVDVTGTVVWANRLVETLCNAAPGSLCGTPSEALFPREYVEERLEMIREAATTGRPIVCDGVCWGLLRRTTFRPIPTPVQQPAQVLIVCRPKPSDEASLGDNAPPVRRARFNDLGPLAVLTERELEVLDLIGRGLSTAQIARHLHRSVKTVEWHRVSLGEKLGVTNRVELARIALNAGFSSGALPPVRTAAPASDLRPSPPDPANG